MSKSKISLILLVKNIIKFITIYLEEIQAYVDIDDNISDYFSENSIFYISEDIEINFNDFDNKSNFPILSDMDDIEVIKLLPSDSQFKTFEVISKKSQSKYYAYTIKEEQKKINLSILSSVNHGSLAIYTGLSYFNLRKKPGLTLFSKFYKNGYLSDLLNQEQMNKPVPFFNNTKKNDNSLWNCIRNVLFKFNWHSKFLVAFKMNFT